MTYSEFILRKELLSTDYDIERFRLLTEYDPVGNKCFEAQIKEAETKRDAIVQGIASVIIMQDKKWNR